MKITFVSLGSEQLAVSLLANIARINGHSVELAFCSALFHDRFNLEIPWLNKYFDDTKETLKMIQEQNPDVLVFSVLTATYEWMINIAKASKEINPNIKTIFGGVHVSAVPEKAIKKNEVDYVVVGEGEEAFIEILNAIEKRDFNSPIINTMFTSDSGEVIRGTNKPFVQNLDRLPPFTKELYDPHIPIDSHYITMASRGCPYRCTFCFNNFFAELPETKIKGNYVRQRSVEHVIMELKYAKQRYKNLKWIDFEDDVFTTNKSWLKEFLPIYKKEINLPFECLTHPRHMDDEIAKMLKEAGCKWVQIGVQTIDDGFKGKNLRRYEKAGHIKRSLKAMINAGLKVKADHMFGLPNEPIEAQENARRMYAEYCPVRIQTYWTCFLPGTELMNEAIKTGFISDEEAERVYEGKDFYFFRNPNNIKDKLLVKKYEGYQLLFKIYPLLPRFVRIKLKEKHVRWIPKQLKVFLGTFADMFNALIHLNPTFFAYAEYYIFHLIGFFKLKMGLKKGSASRVINKTSFNFDRLKDFR